MQFIFITTNFFLFFLQDYLALLSLSPIMEVFPAQIQTVFLRDALLVAELRAISNFFPLNRKLSPASTLEIGTGGHHAAHVSFILCPYSLLNNNSFKESLSKLPNEAYGIISSHSSTLKLPNLI